jgi:photosystem II stability/assembly factor-like uncharacterized protein
MRLLTLLLLLAGGLVAEDRWVSQYFHDVDREEMKFSSIGFCSATRGVVLGGLSKNGGNFKPLAMVTSNAGKTWAPMPMEEFGSGLYFLDETSGWMITESGIWFTDECGRSWRRIHKQRNLNQVYFATRERGWAVGDHKIAIETFDGGKTWSRIKAAEELESNPDRTSFTVIAPTGARTLLMVARSARPRFFRMPLWLDPEPQRRQEVPAYTVTLQTTDGGVTWTASKTSMFGRISAIRATPAGQGLLLVEFDDYFTFPSELYVIGSDTQDPSLTLRRKDIAITDILATPSFYVAGFQPPGALFRSPIPGKVRILHSVDRKSWKEQRVDYRAVATRVMMAESGGKVWAATDTGMILSLVRE